MQLLLEAGADKETKDVVSERDSYGHTHTHNLVLTLIWSAHAYMELLVTLTDTFFQYYLFLLLPFSHTVFHCPAHLFAILFTVYMVFFSLSLISVYVYTY